MIRLVTGDILESNAEALVNTVNCAGVMGKGLAAQFKEAYPENYRLYRVACIKNEVQLGKMFTFQTRAKDGGPQFIINFPTKEHWKMKSNMADIESGLQDLVVTIARHGICSIAIPGLGCSNGGLKWVDVRPRIESAMSALLPSVDVQLYEP